MSQRLSRRQILRAGVAGVAAAAIGMPYALDAREAVSIELVAGWNSVSWCGPDTPAAEALGSLPLRYAFSWDIASQTWLGYAPNTPVDTIGTLHHGQPLWMRLTADAEWSQPLFRGPFPPSIEIPVGWSYLGWAGLHQPVWVAFGESELGLVAEARRWQTESGAWVSYVPGRSAQQLFAVLHPADAVWVRTRLPGGRWNPIQGVLPSELGNEVVQGEATYYHPALAGGPMRCTGKAYNPSDTSIAASISWPCGTRLRVWRDERFADVIVQDTGNLAEYQVDLSEAAFLQLGLLAEGRIDVLIEVRS